MVQLVFSKLALQRAFVVLAEPVDELLARQISFAQAPALSLAQLVAPLLALPARHERQSPRYLLLPLFSETSGHDRSYEFPKAHVYQL